MFLTRSFIIVLLIAQALICSPSFADDSYRSKYGLDIKGFKSNLFKDVGWLGGLRYARYIGTSQVHIGLAGFYGSPRGDNPAVQYLYYGGLTLGADGRWGKIGVFEFGLVLGYGQGEIKTMGLKKESAYVVEPTASAGFALGLGWRLNFSVGYVHMNGSRYFSGSTFGIRLDNRGGTAIKAID
jgi:hypothetical protein